MSTVYYFMCAKTTPDTVLPVTARDQQEYNRRIANAFRAQVGGRLVVGDLKLRPVGTSVANHLLCDGTIIKRSSFPELFKLLGTTFSAGDGLTTFGLPDYRTTAPIMPTASPTQTVTPSTTTTTANPPPNPPTDPGETGGIAGSYVPTGGRDPKPGVNTP